MSRSSSAYIIGFGRTATGSFNGSLAGFAAPQLGAFAVRGALARSSVPGDQVDEVILGNVCGANLGQAPSSQASVAAGIPWKVPTTTVNKVCSSGMKAAMFAAQGIQLGQRHVVVAGGFESMSNVPYYVPRGRTGYAYGHGEFLDGLLKDGLWDSFEQKHMGMCAEKCAKDFQISREQQDEFAIESCKRAIEAHKAGAFRGEIVDVEIPGKKGKPHTIFNADESLLKINVEKIPSLRPAFLKEDGTVTAANASSLNDGASALVLASEEFVKAHGIKPLAKIRGYDDAAQKSVDFTTAPALAMPLALKRAGLEVKDVDLWEINEAFSVVALANMKILNLDVDKVNVHGGAVALGHPIGSSGSRIIISLLTALTLRDGHIGCAGICNGGGGASAIVVERM